MDFYSDKEVYQLIEKDFIFLRVWLKRGYGFFLRGAGGGGYAKNSMQKF